MDRWLAVSLALLGGCTPGSSQSELAVAPDASLPALAPTDQVDLLLLVDSSCPMAEEQASLTAALPRLMRMLLAGDLDDDGAPERPPLDVQIGVVTADMGTGGYTVPTCQGDFGDDGILRTEGRTDLPGCDAVYPSVLRGRPGEDPDALARDLACLATVGTGGCGFEQPLEGILKALSPAAPTESTALGYTPPRFFADTTGHADGPNAGLVRPDSVLAVVVVSDEDDCSALDPEVFDDESTVYPSDLNLRCFLYREAIHPVARYVDGLLALRRDPRRLVYLPIVGIPSDLERAPHEPPDWDRLISEDLAVRDDRMEERLDAPFGRLFPSCNVPGRGVAFPPVRTVELARRLDRAGAGVGVASICGEDYADAMTALARLIGEAAAGGD
ncbi:MAG: hypothetical protein H6719_18495 [Sandaracinaceae bacterium]|nr:hypothetical protein [Sandaracinaceae bacterium]